MGCCVLGCSITSCSQVTSGCGWCTKDGGYAVGYEKNVETLADRKRTTLTLKKECKGKKLRTTHFSLKHHPFAHVQKLCPENLPNTFLSCI